MTRLQYLFVFLNALFRLSLGFKGDSACQRRICVTATVDGDIATYEVTATQDPLGWVALGFGPRMINTHSIIMWKNEDGSTTMSQRFTAAYREPHPVSRPPRIATLVNPQSVSASAKSTTFAFQVPTNHSLLASANPKERLVFAYSPVRPDKDPDSTLAPHTGVGHLSFDLTKDMSAIPSTAATASSSPKRPSIKIQQGTNLYYTKLEKLVILHGFLVSIGFLVLLPAGSLIGRWGRSFTPRWFKAHWISNMLLALPVITFGVVLGPVIVFSKDSYRVHFANTHEVCGAILLLVYYAQVLLGRYIHHCRSVKVKSGTLSSNHPPLNIMHICLGILIIALAFFQVRSGLEWWETLTGRGPITTWALPLWQSWTVLLPIVYFSGYVLLPRQLRLEREAIYAPIPAVVAEDNSQAAHLLAEEEN